MAFRGLLLCLAASVFGGYSFAAELRFQLGVPTNSPLSSYGREAIGTLGVQAQELGTTAPAFKLLNAVGDGTLTGAWVPPHFFIGIDSAFEILGNAPFGLDAPAYVSWRFDPATLAVANSLYQAHKVKGIPCGVQPEVGGIWTKKPIRSTADFRALRLRAVGGTIPAFVSLGANVTALPGGEIVPALERGLIDATVGLQIIEDVRTLNLPRLLPWYAEPPLYPARGIDLIVNAAHWNSLPPATQARLESQCRAIAARMHSELARTGSAVREEAARGGMKTYKLPGTVVDALRRALAPSVKPGETMSSAARMLFASQQGSAAPAVAQIAQAQQSRQVASASGRTVSPEGFVDLVAGVGPDGGPCRIRSLASFAQTQYQWRGACSSGYGEGEGVMASKSSSVVAVSRGVLRNGLREGSWEVYFRNVGTREIKTWTPRFREGKNTTPGLFANAPTIPPSQLPAWAREVEKDDVAKSPESPSAGPAAGTPRATAAAPPGRPYKGHLYVMRIDMTGTVGGSAGQTTSRFMSAIAPDRATAQRLFDDYARNARYMMTQGQQIETRVHECSAAGQGPYFALFVDEPDLNDEIRKLGTKGAAGWTCGAATPEAAAQSALGGCRKFGQCRPRPTANHYLFVSSHHAGGGAKLYDHATYGVRPGGQVGTMAFQQNNYDYTGCFWSKGRLVGEGFSTGTRGEPGNGADNISFNCRAFL